jgi:hypothetical protein
MYYMPKMIYCQPLEKSSFRNFFLTLVLLIKVLLYVPFRYYFNIVLLGIVIGQSNYYLIRVMDRH